MQNKENINKKWKRGENWSKDEKEIFLDIMRNSAGIIEDKRTDTNTNKKKKAEWLLVRDKLQELSGSNREVDQLKGIWKRWKLSAKKNVSAANRAIRATGGGPPPPSPSEGDLLIKELCPNDFVIESNIYDSDGVLERAHSPKPEEYQEVIEIVYEQNDPLTAVAEEEPTEDPYIQEPMESPNTTPKPRTKKKLPKTLNHKGLIVSSNNEVKTLQKQILSEEHAMKMEILKVELDIQHTKRMHDIAKNEIEIEILREALKKVAKGTPSSGTPL